MMNVILLLIVLLIIGTVGYYLYKSNRQGQKCIGCPYAKQCHKKSCHPH